MVRYTRETSPWKKRVLLPIWIIRNGLAFILVALYAFALSVLATDPTDELNEEFDKSTINQAKAIVAVFMSLFVISILLDIWCMIQYVRHALSPRTFLIINALQLVYWIAIIVLQLVGFASNGRAYISLFSIACLILYLSLFVYACTVFRRDRQLRTSASGHYAPTANPSFGNHLSAQEYGQTGYGGPYSQPLAYNAPHGGEELKSVKPQQYQ